MLLESIFDLISFSATKGSSSSSSESSSSSSSLNSSLSFLRGRPDDLLAVVVALFSVGSSSFGSSGGSPNRFLRLASNKARFLRVLFLETIIFLTSDRFNFVSTTEVSGCPLREDLAGGEGDGGGDGEGDRDLTAAS